MNGDTEKIENLIAMAERLTEAFEADIVALKAGRPKEMRSLDPEIQRLTVMYGREASTLDLNRAKSAPPELRKRFAAATGRFRDCLKLQQRLVVRVRNASEGLIKAVAGEVQRIRAPMCTYASAARGPAPRPQPGANSFVFNSVV